MLNQTESTKEREMQNQNVTCDTNLNSNDARGRARLTFEMYHVTCSGMVIEFTDARATMNKG